MKAFDEAEAEHLIADVRGATESGVSTRRERALADQLEAALAALENAKIDRAHYASAFVARH